MKRFQENFLSSRSNKKHRKETKDKSFLVEYSGKKLELRFPLPHLSNLDWIMRKDFFVFLLKEKLFPNMKEISETAGVCRSLYGFLGNDILSSDGWICFVVGDGTKPRTATTVSFLSNWKIFSIDPEMDVEFCKNQKITCVAEKAEKFLENNEFDKEANICLLSVHSHAPMAKIFKIAEEKWKDSRIFAITLDCCVETKHEGRIKLKKTQEDFGIFSVERTKKFWDTM